MAKITAVKCDACDHMDVPADDAEIPSGFLLVDIYQEGLGHSEARVYCSWACLSDVALHRSQPPKVKRKRRTKAEMLAAAQTKAGATANGG